MRVGVGVRVRVGVRVGVKVRVRLTLTATSGMRTEPMESTQHAISHPYLQARRRWG